MMRQALSPRQQRGASSRVALHTGLLSFKFYLHRDQANLPFLWKMSQLRPEHQEQS